MYVSVTKFSIFRC